MQAAKAAIDATNKNLAKENLRQKLLPVVFFFGGYIKGWKLIILAKDVFLERKQTSDDETHHFYLDVLERVC